MKGFFDLLIGDEVHEYKGRGSAQGIAAGVLADSCGKSLTLTGTLTGGYSSTLFHLLYRFSPDIRAEFGRSEEGRWIQRYGFLEQTVRHSDDGDSFEDGRNSRRKGYRKTVRERPGLAPSALFHLIGNSIFLRLSDVASGLPSYEEQVLLSGMDRETDFTGFSQRKAYDAVFDTLRQALAEALAKGSKRLLATYLQTLLAYPDGCTRGETVFDPQTGNVLIQMPPLSEDKLYPKEQALVDLVAAERLAGRKVLVYATHTGTRDITERMEQFLTTARVPGGGAEGRHGGPGPPGVLGGGTGQAGGGRGHLPSPPGADRAGPHRLPNAWFGSRQITACTSMRQASRRSWRIGQTRPVKVIYMAYRNTLQADALKLVAKKLQSSLAVEGELPEDGLAAFGDDGDDLMLALARQIVSGDETGGDSESVEQVFAQARDAEASAEEFLVDDGWKATVGDRTGA